MRRFTWVLLLLVVKPCLSQRGVQLEALPAMSFYNGDMSNGFLSLRTIGPAGMVNFKYDWGDIAVLRIGVGYGHVSANDKYNKSADVRSRNLNFKTNIAEVMAGVEVNLLDPENTNTYPYALAGLGLYHFNPYTFDKNDRKTFLQPLSTEGQGLPEYPDRKEYKLTQLCIPFGVGFKHIVKAKYAIGFEVGFRYLFTDYFDDVSKTYIDPNILRDRKGEIAVELAARQVNSTPAIGDRRGNPDNKDIYVMAGAKFTLFLSKKKPEKVVTEDEALPK
jgi:hypothetical protein